MVAPHLLSSSCSLSSFYPPFILSLSSPLSIYPLSVSSSPIRYDLSVLTSSFLHYLFIPSLPPYPLSIPFLSPPYPLPIPSLSPRYILYTSVSYFYSQHLPEVWGLGIFLVCHQVIYWIHAKVYLSPLHLTTSSTHYCCFDLISSCSSPF